MKTLGIIIDELVAGTICLVAFIMYAFIGLLLLATTGVGLLAILGIACMAICCS